MATRAYGPRRRQQRSEETRERIMSAVRDLLSEGAFHESTVEEVADRAGVSRATLYQHFRSRLDLVDAICDAFAENPALVTLRESVELPDVDQALDETIAQATRFWTSEELLLEQMYGASVVDPAAHDLVERQRGDRRSEMARLARRLRASGRLRDGLGGERRAVAVLLVLTSFETFRELRREGQSERDVINALQEMARPLLLG